MKQLFSAILFLFCTFLLAGCAGRHAGNTLLENASPDTSALALYCYDGSITTCSYLYDSTEVQKALQSLSAVDAKKSGNFTPSQAAAPVYAISIGGKDGNDIQAAWSNGYWIAQNGVSYRFDYDFKALASEYSWSDPQTWTSTAILPCARHLRQDSSGWYAPFLTPAEPLDPPENISASMVSRENDAITVAFENQGDAQWTYGKYFSLHVLLDGIWYVVPPIPDSIWGFPDIACILPAHTAQQETYSLTMYGSLPDGTYRLVAENLAVELTLP